MRKSSWALLCVAAVIGGLYESSFLGSAPDMLDYIKPILPVCVMLFMLNRKSGAYIVAVLSGVVIDMLSPLPGGWTMMRWLVVLLFVDLLSEKITTNRSLYSAVALAVSARILDRVISQLMSWIYPILSGQPLAFEPWARLPGVLIADALIVALIFVSVTIFTKRFVIAVEARRERYE
ncbi:MAG: hypothetical protein PHS79_02595 [Patescibacteria group bacterium]|nr:hypothetical protein [Patescibacteria group bacterium]